MSFEPSKMSTIIPKQKASWLVPHTVDGSFEILHQLRLVVYPCLSHYFQGFMHPRWCRISSINSLFLTPQITPTLISQIHPESTPFDFSSCSGFPVGLKFLTSFVG